MTTTVRIDVHTVRDAKSFHEVFAKAMGFPATYGRNMDAWIDCMSSLDKPAAGMTKVHAKAGGMVLLHLDKAGDFAKHSPELFAQFLDAVAFVNWRQVEAGRPALLAMAYEKT